jgi:L-alanine-DL-glutamate epimerase-like enolase superfamily enzyme
MRISKVEAILLRPRGTIDTAIADGRVLVRVHTDEGVTGLGEIDSSPAIAKGTNDTPRSHKICSGLGALLLGENPLEIGRLCQKMYEGSLYFGCRGAAIHTISGVEYCVQTTELNQRLVGEPFPVVDGYVAIPTGPGLGIELDEAALQEFSVA